MALDRLKVLYISGAGRSGSTLLGRILGHAPGLISVGELNLIWTRGVINNEVCSCGALFHDCPFWTAVFDRAFGGFGRVDAEELTRFFAATIRPRDLPVLLRGTDHARYHEEFQSHTETLRRLYRAVADISGNRVIVDTSKHAGYALLLGNMPDIDLHVIHLVRDSRAVTYSYLRRKVRFEVNGLKTYMDQKQALEGALSWMRDNAFSELLRWRRSKYLFLRYEDFTDAPRAAIGRVADFVNENLDQLPWDGSHAVRLGDTHVASGNPMRFENGSIEIRSDDEWRTAMHGGDRALATVLTAPLLLRYGYFSPAASTVAKPLLNR